jgi:hypothetical protein
VWLHTHQWVVTSPERSPLPTSDPSVPRDPVLSRDLRGMPHGSRDANELGWCRLVRSRPGR